MFFLGLLSTRSRPTRSGMPLDEAREGLSQPVSWRARSGRNGIRLDWLSGPRCVFEHSVALRPSNTLAVLLSSLVVG